MGTVVLHGSEGVVGVCLTEGERAVLDLRNLVYEFVVKLKSELSCDVLACSSRKLKLEGDTSLVGCREELCLDLWPDKSYRCHKHNDRNDHNYSPVTDTPVDQMAVSS